MIYLTSKYSHTNFSHFFQDDPDETCRNCQKSFNILANHLAKKKVCKDKYTQEEINEAKRLKKALRNHRHQNQNKEAKAAYNSEYQKANKKLLAEKRKSYILKNQKSISIKKKNYNQKHQHQIVKKQRAYNSKNQENIVKKQRAYNLKNKENIVKKQDLNFYKEILALNERANKIPL